MTTTKNSKLDPLAALLDKGEKQAKKPQKKQVKEKQEQPNQKKQFLLSLPIDLHKKIKIKAAQEDITLNAFIVAAVQKYIDA